MASNNSVVQNAGCSVENQRGNLRKVKWKAHQFETEACIAVQAKLVIIGKDVKDFFGKGVDKGNSFFFF